MKSLVTIGEVSNRVDAMNQGCFDRLTDVSDISFAPGASVSARFS